jgi:hypothetical protein
MTRTLRQGTSAQADETDEVLFLDDQGNAFSFADLEPVSEDERRRLGFPFDVPDDLNEDEAAWIRRQRELGKSGER